MKKAGLAEHSQQPVQTVRPVRPRKAGQTAHLDRERRELLDRMRNLRNVAVHAGREMSRVSPDEAREFIALREAVTDKLRSLKR